MSATIKLMIDGQEISARPGQTILEAAEENGVWIPRLCAHEELEPVGSCRVCTVKVNGRPQAACVQRRLQQGVALVRPRAPVGVPRQAGQQRGAAAYTQSPHLALLGSVAGANPSERHRCSTKCPRQDSPIAV